MLSYKDSGGAKYFCPENFAPIPNFISDSFLVRCKVHDLLGQSSMLIDYSDWRARYAFDPGR